jgi:hypothetical protein
VRSAERSPLSSSIWPTCFSRATTAALLEEYEYIARGYPGFSLTEIRQCSPRERDYWVEMTAWHIQRDSK